MIPLPRQIVVLISLLTGHHFFRFRCQRVLFMSFRYLCLASFFFRHFLTLGTLHPSSQDLG